MAKVKYGTVDIPDESFKDENITAHISIRIPMTLLKDLKALSLNEKYSGKYQTLMKDVLTNYVLKQDGSIKPVSRPFESQTKKVYFAPTVSGEVKKVEHVRHLLAKKRNISTTTKKRA